MIYTEWDMTERLFKKRNLFPDDLDGDYKIQGQFPLWLLILLLGLFLSAIVFCSTNNDCPPKYHPVRIHLHLKRISGCLLHCFRYADYCLIGGLAVMWSCIVAAVMKCAVLSRFCARCRCLQCWASWWVPCWSARQPPRWSVSCTCWAWCSASVTPCWGSRSWPGATASEVTQVFRLAKLTFRACGLGLKPF